MQSLKDTINKNKNKQNKKQKQTCLVLLITTTKKTPSMSWNEWKERTGYKERYMSRGTTRSKNPF